MGLLTIITLGPTLVDPIGCGAPECPNIELPDGGSAPCINGLAPTVPLWIYISDDRPLRTTTKEN